MKQLLSTVCPAALLFTLFLSAQNLYANNLNECLMKALEIAEDSVTVGQLREQCKQEAGKESLAPPSETDSAVKNGPEETVLKTAQAKKPAFFPHKKHQGKYPCGKCHHGKSASGTRVKYTPETVVYKCTTCHNSDMPNKELNSFKLAGHNLCRECHRKNQNITSAKCSTCHLKNL